MRIWGVLGAVVVLAAAGAGAAWWFVIGQQQAREEAAAETVGAYAAAWEAGDWAALGARVAPPSAPAVDGHRALVRDLDPEVLDVEPVTLVVDGEAATADLAVTVTLADVEDWSWTAPLELVWDGELWRVAWTPAAVHPEYVEGGRFRLTRSLEPRAAILDRDGEVLVSGEADERAGPPGGFLVHVLGRTGELTAEQAEELGPAYAEGDAAGVFGLELALEAQLAGEPATTVSIVDPDGELVADVFRDEGLPPADARLTVDGAVQEAAEAALGDVGRPAALVAVDAGTMEIRAAASRPVEGFNRAFEGRYPPGSTFKVVTTAALLGSGLGAEASFDCPGQRSVGGRPFRNAGDRALGTIDLRTAFAESCNTAYVGVMPGAEEELAAAAAAYGFDGSAHDVAVPAFGGEYPEPADLVEAAAAAIGQARVEASPLHLATVAAAAVTGEWRPATLFADGDAERAARPVPGDPEVMRELMLETVASGTGTAAQVDGGQIGGKTGSAEFGTGDPLDTHAWFIGFSDDLAFAVLVEGGGAGGQVAGPLAARFVEALG